MIIDVKPKDLGLPTEAYISVEEIHDVGDPSLTCIDTDSHDLWTNVCFTLEMDIVSHPGTVVFVMVIILGNGNKPRSSPRAHLSLRVS